MERDALAGADVVILALQTQVERHVDLSEERLVAVRADRETGAVEREAVDVLGRVVREVDL